MFVESVGRVQIDNPHTDGIVNPGDRGHMRSWRFDDPAHFSWSVGSSPAQKLSDEWSIESGLWTMRPYPMLKCMAPAPDYSLLKDNTLWDGNSGEWEYQMPDADNPNLSRLWKEVTPTPLVGIAGKKWLWFHDGRGMYNSTLAYKGRATYIAGVEGTNALFEDPSFLLQSYRYFPTPDFLSTHYTYLEVDLFGYQFGNAYTNWAITIPGPSATNEKRTLALGVQTEQDPTTWTVLQRFESANSELDSNGVLREVLQFETIDGMFLLTLNGEEFAFVIPEEYKCPIFTPPPSGVDSPSVSQTTPRVTVYGQAAMLNFSRLDFHGTGESVVVPARADLKYTYPVDPTVFNVSDTDQNGTASAWTPLGTSVAVTGVSEHADANGDILFRPKVVCSHLESWTRPAVYVATVDWPPTISAGTAYVYDTAADTDVLVSASGEVAEDWRHSSCDIELELDNADADTLLSGWGLKGNNKVTVDAGWRTDTGFSNPRHFVGYLTQRAHAREAEKPGRTRITLPCQDAFFRLDKKYWLDLGIFEGQTVNAIVHRVLNQCGFPDSLISVDSDVQTLTLERAVFGAEPRFDFREDTPVIEGLNAILSSLGLKWGVDQTGTIFVKRPTEYVSGTSTVSFTLDDDSTTDSDLVYALRAETQYDALEDGRPFRNYVLCKVERNGEEQVVEVWDYDSTSASRSLSHHVSSDANFIGDDWWHVMVGENEQSAYEYANRIIRDRAGDRTGASARVANRRATISFNADFQPNLWPDQYVKVQATGIGVATDSIYQVVSKSWGIGEDGRYTARFTARFVQ